MEMYKDTMAYKASVLSYIDSIIGPWMAAIIQNMRMHVISSTGAEYDEAALKLANANRKVFLLGIILRTDY